LVFLGPSNFQKNHLEAIKMSTGVKNNFGRETESLDKSKPVFVYRLSGGQSSSVANAVRAAGFKEVY
jgi:rhodanese-related sulfurtransferase